MKGVSLLDDQEIRSLISQPLLFDEQQREVPLKLNHGLFMGIALRGEQGVCGYRAKAHSHAVDLLSDTVHSVNDFWDPIPDAGENDFILEPEEFYLLASRERIVVPPEFCAEMIPYDPASGEVRTHYAGFFDSGFGWTTPRGAQVVLEVRSHDVPFRIADGQTFFRVQYHRCCEVPENLYGDDGSHYQGQRLKLAKYFTL